MTPTRLVLTTGATAALVLLATPEVPWSFRLVAAVLVAATIAAGQHWRLPAATGAGLLGLVVIVGAGPAGTLGPVGLLVWAVPTWVVMLLAATTAGPRRPAPRDTRTRLRLVAGEVAAVLSTVPLVVLAADARAVTATWAAAGAAVAVVLLLLVTSRRPPHIGGPGPRP